MKTEKPGRDPVKSAGDKWKLTRSQRKNLLAWIGEGLTPREINKRAEGLKSPFKVTRQAIDYYRQKTGQKVVQERKAEDEGAFKIGFAQKEKRVEALNKIAELLYSDIVTGRGLWLVADKRRIGYGEDAEIYDIEKFNQSELSEFRATLEDLAKEVGDRSAGRKIGIELPDDEGSESGSTYKFYIGLDPGKV
jgi:hypothetical protein